VEVIVVCDQTISLAAKPSPAVELDAILKQMRATTELPEVLNKGGMSDKAFAQWAIADLGECLQVVLRPVHD